MRRRAIAFGAVFASLTGLRVVAGQGTVAPAQVAPAQVAPAAPLGPPVRRIETAAAVSSESLGAITSVRPLSDGRVLLNDGTRRRLILMDSTLTTIGVVLDSLTEVENAYGTRAGALIPYLGDSTLFVDPATYAMLVIDPAGRIVRVRSVPRAQDATLIGNTSTTYGLPGIDARGRLVYRIAAQPARPLVRPPAGVPYIPSPPDSAFLVGIHLDTRRLDTLAAVRMPRITMAVRQTSDGLNVNSVHSPLPLVDEWAVLPDGTVAIVRGRDYRVEWLHADGTMTSSEKLPFPWVRLADEDKTRFADSLKTQQTRNARNNHTLQTIIWSNLLNKPYPADFAPAPAFTLPPGMPRDWILPTGLTFPAGYTFGCPPGVAPNGPSSSGNTPNGAPPTAVPPNAVPPAAIPPVSPARPPSCIASPFADYYGSGYTPPAPRYRVPDVARAEDLPDYRPPIGPGSVRADADGNLWIRTIPMKPTPGGLVYDVVSRAGALVDRIQLPSGYTLAGFGPGKVVYLTTRDAKGLHLARVRLR